MIDYVTFNRGNDYCRLIIKTKILLSFSKDIFIRPYHFLFLSFTK